MLLVLVALVPRLWEPDLGPYGERQAGYLDSAARHGTDGIVAMVASPGAPLLAVLDVPRRTVHASLSSWVVARGIVDATAVLLLFVAVRPVAGVVGATGAGALLATSPVAIVASRDLAGPFAAPLMAAALLAGISLSRRPSMPNGLILGAVLGLLARSGVPGLLVVGLGAVALALAGASGRVGIGTAALLVVLGGPAIVGSLGELASGSGGPNSVLAGMDFPGSLLTGLAYRPQDGWPPGASFSVPPTTIALGAVVVVAAVAGSWHAVAAARRGERQTLLVAVWCLACGMAAVVGRVPPPAALGGTDGALVAIVPLLAGLVALPNAARAPVLRWSGLTALMVVFIAQVGMLGASGRAIVDAAGQGGVFSSAGRPGASPGDALRLGTAASLREWQALAAITRDATARAGTDEVVLLPPSSLRDEQAMLSALVRDDVRLRMLPVSLVLPLERETVYLVSSEAISPRDGDWPVEFRRPASRTAVVSSAGVDTGARLVTLRPRPADDWLARTRPVREGRFGDGSRLVGASLTASHAGSVAVRLFWEVPAASDGRSVGMHVRLAWGGDGATVAVEQPLPAVADRRAGEVTVVSATLPQPEAERSDAPLVVWLVDASGRTIRTLAGAEALELPR